MRIVLVDSSRTVLRIVSDLVEQAHHEVRPFSDGLQALEYLRIDPEVRALITSSEPISMGGAQLCLEARKLAGQRRPLYIIMMSSSDEHQNVVRALDNGADDFMHKPPIAEELSARLRAADRVTSMQRELIQNATTDSLTGVFNRRAFFERAAEWSTQAAAGQIMTATMLDIDHFKKVNDGYGHHVGDIVLRAVAAKAAAVNGVVGRLGGEEFGLLTRGPLTIALQVAEQLRTTIANESVQTTAGPLSVTCSFGVSEWERGDSVDGLLKRADAALYKAKNAGRNRVVAAETSAAKSGMAVSERCN
jgi:two-component system cell cycle response regulator